jgi:hypothetical protein
MDLTPQITALQSQVDALGRQIEEKEGEEEVLVVRSSFLSSRLLFGVEIFFFFFFFRKTQIEDKAAKLVEARSHCLYYENYEATQTAKCRDLDETAREIAATLEVSAHFFEGSTSSNSESWFRRNC